MLEYHASAIGDKRVGEHGKRCFVLSKSKVTKGGPRQRPTVGFFILIAESESGGSRSHVNVMDG